MEMNFCRRCGAALTQKASHVFTCENHHTLYANSSPAVSAILFNSQGEALTIRRAVAPGMGELDFPGGFCDDRETAETALARELAEEINLQPEHYSAPQFLCTGIDDYEFGGETLPVFTLVYTATIIDDAPIATGDDAEQATFVPLGSIQPEKVYFAALREAVVLLQKKGDL